MNLLMNGLLRFQENCIRNNAILHPPNIRGALSQRYGVRGFEIGFMLMGASYVVGALFVMYGFLFTFKRDSISEHSTAGNSL